MNYIEKYSILLRWWLFFAIASLGTLVLFLSGVVQKVQQADVTKISFLIFAVFAYFTVRTGMDTYNLCIANKFTSRNISTFYKKSEIGWFVSDMLLTLGMIGTVAGFIYMLSTSFAGMDSLNAGNMQGMLMKMSAGMSTALYTTAAGLVCSLLLKLQLFNFTNRLDFISDLLDGHNASQTLP